MNPFKEPHIQSGIRFSRICDRMQISKGDSDQILATLIREIIRFQSETLELAQDGMGEASPNGPSGDSESKFYLHLGDLWLPKHANYFESTRTGKLGGRRQLIQKCNYGTNRRING